METIEKSVEVLNDLIEINNDRIAGFEHAIKDLGEGDADLKAVFEKFASDSRQNVQELTLAVNRVGGEAETGTSGTGSIHRAWLDVKATFTGHDRKSVLDECERGEDAIKKAYQSALTDNEDFPAGILQVISSQQQTVSAGHDKIKALRDSQAS
jgi:uncharacterized protein (TIGR02284 family)